MLKHIIFIVQKKLPDVRILIEECENRGIQVHLSFPKEETLIEETLYITDNGDICHGLLEEKANVLVWLHENNREENVSQAPYALENIEEVDLCYLERIYQRFQNLPWEIAQTPRCIIREMTEEDLDAVYEVYAAPSITKYMEGLYKERKKELEYTRSYIKHAYRFWGYGTWVIVRKADEKIIGRVGYNLRDGFEDVELGFVIMEEEQRKGYALECCEAVLKIGKEEYEFDTVQALVKEQNMPSLKLCEKLGFSNMGKVQVENEVYLKWIKNLQSS
ncbi:MAG: GNAT family N-acetyltransferase [Lachnospiraceae bacterium]|nr:GNAT family N-acetyltransferase [Lachnospiraceae bacterium]